MKQSDSSVSSRKSVASEARDDSIKNVATRKRLQQPCLGFGIMCGILAGLVYALNTLLVKMIESSEALQLSASRCFTQSLILLPYATYKWKRGALDIIGSPEMFKFLIIRAATGSTGSILHYQSIQRLPVGDAVTLLFTSTVFSAILAFIFLKEPLQIVDCLMIALTFSGVVLVSKPTLIFGGEIEEGKVKGEIIAGVLFGLASGLMNGCTMVVLRKLGQQKTDPSLNILYYSFLGSVTSSIMVAATQSFRLPCLHEVPYISMLGITGIGGQIFITLGLQYERAAVIPAVRSLQIVFVYILQITILHDQPSLLSVVGSVCIFVSVLGFSLKKLYQALKTEKKK